MKRNLLLAAMFIFGLLMLTDAARACEPCVEILDLEQTTTAADVIVIGRLVREGPSTGFGPDWLEIEILEVWKGELEQARIQVNSWDGMCAYGVILFDHEPHLIFLEKQGDIYDTVENGCAVRSILIEGNQIITDDGPVPLDEFADSLGLSASRQTMPEQGAQSSIPWTPVLVGIVIILAMTVGFYLVLKRLARP
ncbi:MAG: hypothetical protein PVG63_00535 [Anaerolineales bacterium]|jgi:hypothetical protein